MRDGISGCSALNVSFEVHQCLSDGVLFVFLGSELTEFGKLGVVGHSEPKRLLTQGCRVLSLVVPMGLSYEPVWA